MNTARRPRRSLSAALLTGAFLTGAFLTGPALAAQPNPTQVNLTLKGCSIAELDPKGEALKSNSPDGCAKLNRATQRLREPAFVLLRLKPGPHTFRVTNANIAWPADLLIQGARNRALPKTEGGQITAGQTFDFRIDLVPGVYLISAPKIPTPEYKLVVER